MRGHRGQVRSLSVEPENGELLASGGEDKTVRIWYIPTGKCLKVFTMSAPVTCVNYCPNAKRTLLLVWFLMFWKRAVNKNILFGFNCDANTL